MWLEVEEIVAEIYSTDVKADGPIPGGELDVEFWVGGGEEAGSPRRHGDTEEGVRKRGIWRGLGVHLRQGRRVGSVPDGADFPEGSRDGGVRRHGGEGW